MRRILLATDLGEGARNAARKACQLAARTGADLKVLHAVPSATDYDERSALRARLIGEVRQILDSLAAPHLDVSVSLPFGDPVEAISREADRFGPDLVILGAERDIRLRDVFLGTTATEVVRRSHHPVLVVQRDAGRPWAKVMAAIDDDDADTVIRLAVDVGRPRDLYVVHAFGSVAEALFGDGELLEKTRAGQSARVEIILSEMRGASAVGVHHLVEEGNPVDLIIKAWTDLDPDLVVIGTHGRTGLAWLLDGGVADTVLLGCPSDILVAAARSDGR